MKSFDGNNQVFATHDSRLLDPCPDCRTPGSFRWLFKTDIIKLSCPICNWGIVDKDQVNLLIKWNLISRGFLKE